MIYWLILVALGGVGVDIEAIAVGTESQCLAAKAAIEEQRSARDLLRTYCVEAAR